jgi:hypothetical protein
MWGRGFSRNPWFTTLRKNRIFPDTLRVVPKEPTNLN